MQKIVLRMNQEISLEQLFQTKKLNFNPNEEYILNLEIEEGYLYFIEKANNRDFKSFVMVTKDINATIQHNAYFLRTFYNDCIVRFSIRKKETDFITEKLHLYQSSLN